MSLSNILTTNRLLPHFNKNSIYAMKSCIFEQFGCENETQFLCNVLTLACRHKLLSNESIEMVKNTAIKMARKQKMETSDISQVYTVCQYVEHQYKDPLSRLNSNIIDCLGEYLRDKDSYNFACTNKQLYIETKKSSYIKIRLQRKQDNENRFYFKYIYFNDLITLEPDNQSSEMWDIGGTHINTSKYVNELHWYKNTTFGQVFDYWEKKYNTKKENQLVYHLSPNREMFEQKHRRLKKLKWPLNENDCIYIDNGRQYLQGFMLFDKTRLYKLKKGKNNPHVQDPKILNNIGDINSNYNGINDNEALLILKYFDVFKQNVVTVDAIICEKNCTFNDIFNHFLNNIIVKSKNDSIVQLCQLIENSDNKFKFTMCEEVNAMIGEFNDLTCKLNQSIENARLVNGDILIVSLNTHDTILNNRYGRKQLINAMTDMETSGVSYSSNVRRFCYKNTRNMDTSPVDVDSI